MTALTLAIALGAALAMVGLALVLLSIVLVRLSRDAREYRAEALTAWASAKDWKSEARRLARERDTVDRHYAGVPEWTGARHQSHPTITIPTYREGT